MTLKPNSSFAPLSWFYGAAVDTRNALFDRSILKATRISVPVISIGNITSGGSGKTPLVESAARFLAAAGKRVAIVSRGYGRDTRGTVIVSDGISVTGDARSAGDEPVMLAQKLHGVRVIVDEMRARGATTAVERTGAEIVLLDDGFQHRALSRDLDVVAIDSAYSPFETAMLPAGYRREPLRSLRRADAIVITGARNSGENAGLKESVAHWTAARVFTASYVPRAFRRVKTGFSTDLRSTSGKKAVAFCGIAHPENFRRTLESLGMSVSHVAAYPDHHRFTDDDFRSVERAVQEQSADYAVTTEKDLVRMTGEIAFAFLDRLPVYVLEMELIITEDVEWRELLLRKLPKDP